MKVVTMAALAARRHLNPEVVEHVPRLPIHERLVITANESGQVVAEVPHLVPTLGGLAGGELEAGDSRCHWVDVNANDLCAQTPRLDQGRAPAEKRVQDNFAGQVHATVVQVPELRRGSSCWQGKASQHTSELAAQAPSEPSVSTVDGQGTISFSQCDACEVHNRNVPRLERRADARRTPRRDGFFLGKVGRRVEHLETV
jgi:hypothetical protein